MPARWFISVPAHQPGTDINPQTGDAFSKYRNIDTRECEPVLVTKLPHTSNLELS